MQEEKDNLIVPKQTIYISNLNQKIKKQVKDLKYVLFFLFSPFGDVLEIFTKRNNQMRGQAFVIFRDLTSATHAKQSLNNYKIFGKTMVCKVQQKISFAKNRSKLFTVGQKQALSNRTQ